MCSWETTTVRPATPLSIRNVGEASITSMSMTNGSRIGRVITVSHHSTRITPSAIALVNVSSGVVPMPVRTIRTTREERRRLSAKYAGALFSSILLRSQVCFVVIASKRSSGRLRQGSVDQITPDGVAGRSKPPANCADPRFGEVGAPSRRGALRYAAANVIVYGSPRNSPGKAIPTGRVADPSFTDRAGAEPN